MDEVGYLSGRNVKLSEMPEIFFLFDTTIDCVSDISSFYNLALGILTLCFHEVY